MDKCNQLNMANFAIRMILELLPEDILEKFSWHPWSPFSGENLLLLYKKQKKLVWMEGISLDKDVLDCIKKLPGIEEQMKNVRKLGLYPDNRDVLNFCQFLVKNCTKVEKITLNASFEESDSGISSRELNDSPTAPGLITSTIFSHMQPFEKCTPLTLRKITLQKINLRYAASTYCKFINFNTVKNLRIFSCPGADALLAELCKSTKLPDKLKTLEFKHDDNSENEGLSALDGFLCLVSGIKTLTIDVTNARSLPAAAGIIRHKKTLKELNVHANPIVDECVDELVYDYQSFKDICSNCSELEQLSVGFPSVSLIRAKEASFISFEVSRAILLEWATQF